MSVVRALAVCIVFLGAVGTQARADVLWSNSTGTWVWWSTETVPLSDPNSGGDSNGGNGGTSSGNGSGNATSGSGGGSSSSGASTGSGGSGTVASSSGPADALINFGSVPISSTDTTLLDKSPQPWYDSPALDKFFGGNVPNAQQQASFEQAVLADVQHTYALAGLSPNITITPDPNAPAHHILSVVSGTDYKGNPDAIGITNVGHNGFSLIDKLSYGSSLTDLEWAVAHNISHELMHAFGVSQHDDPTGNYLDAASATWSLLTNPNATFSPKAIQDILNTNYSPNASQGGSSAEGITTVDGDQELLAPNPVPEPTTLAFWGLIGMAVVAHRHQGQARRAA